MSRRAILVGAVYLMSALAVRNPSAQADPGTADVKIGTGEEWHNYNGDSDETGFSRLNRITKDNVGKLGLAWFVDLPDEVSLEGTPLAAGGMLYFTGSYATVHAVNAATGELVWTFDPKSWEHNAEKMHFGYGTNRGAAYANGKIFSAAIDGRLFALDAKTGRLLWATETTDPKGGQTITGAPRVFNGKVIIGQGGADFALRGYVSAYDQETGKQVWRFYVVPASPEENKGDPAMEAAAKTWSGKFWTKTGGGGGPWDSMTFDAEFNRIYIGTANAAPYDAEARSPGTGDNLYTASIVALDADTGKYIWHYQVNPRDVWDYDCTQQIVLATLNIDGKPRHVLMQAPKNGFFYVIDRQTGKLISAEKLGKANWADRIDLKTGRPVENPNMRYETGETVLYPFTAGAHSWMRMSFSPSTGLVYVPYMQMASVFRKGQSFEGSVDVGGTFMGERKGDAEDGKGKLIAWDPVAQKARWSVPIDTLWNGGTLATAGNVVFQGTADGNFSAYDATSGARLWSRYVGMGIIAAPMTYELGGRQYVSVLAGYGGSAAIFSDVMNVGWKYTDPRRLLTFALDGKQQLPPSNPRSATIHVQDNSAEVLDPEVVETGRALYMACAACHGRFVVGAGGPAPDLRESPIPLDGGAFWTVLHDGTLIQRGMPRFATFTREQIEAVRQYIRSNGRRAALANK